MRIGNIAYSAFNIAAPLAGSYVSKQVFLQLPEDHQNLTSLSGGFVANGIFGFMTAFGFGERSHRYAAGSICAYFLGYDIARIWAGGGIPPLIYEATAVPGILVQMIAREIVHLPQTFRATGYDNGELASFQTVTQTKRVLGKIAYAFFNVAAPLVADCGLMYLAFQFPRALLPTDTLDRIIFANSLFGLTYVVAVGERIHRYMCGSAFALLATFPGVEISNISTYIALTAGGIFAQILARELIHLPQTLREGNKSGNAKVSAWPSALKRKEKSSDFEGEDGQENWGGSTDMIRHSNYGSSGTDLLPRWGTSDGQILQSLGNEISQIKYHQKTESNGLEESEYRRRTLRTDTGGEYTEEIENVDSWYASGKRMKTTYKVGGGGHSRLPPKIEEID